MYLGQILYTFWTLICCSKFYINQSAQNLEPSWNTNRIRNSTKNLKIKLYYYTVWWYSDFSWWFLFFSTTSLDFWRNKIVFMLNNWLTKHDKLFYFLVVVSLWQTKRRSFGNFWSILASFWSILASFWSILASFWSILASFWSILASFWLIFSDSKNELLKFRFSVQKNFKMVYLWPILS